MKKQKQDYTLFYVSMIIILSVLLIASAVNGYRLENHYQQENDFLKDFLRDEGYIFGEDYVERGNYQCKVYDINGDLMSICKANDVKERKSEGEEQ